MSEFIDDEEFYPAFCGYLSATTAFMTIGATGLELGSRQVICSAIGAGIGFNVCGFVGLCAGSYASLTGRDPLAWPICLGLTALGTVAGGAYAACNANELNSNGNYIPPKIEVMESPSHDRKRTLTEAANDFRARTGESVFVYGQKTLQPA